VVEAVTIPVQAVGGLSIEQAVDMPKLGAPLVVIGAPLAIDDAAFQAAGGDVEAVLTEVVRRVKGIEEPKEGFSGFMAQAGGKLASALRRVARRIQSEEE
jgi:hypothetical protein